MDTVSAIRKEFDELKDLRQTISFFFANLSQKIDGLQTSYIGYVDKVKTNGPGIGIDTSFGIDSLHFQRRYLLEEHDSMKRMFAMINNQIYKDYYKMHKVVGQYINTNISDRKLLESCAPKRSFTVYKDLEPLKEYSFDETVEIHHDLVHIIVELLAYTSSREREWKADLGKANHGLNIDNFVTTEKFENQGIQNRTLMFIEYLEGFHRFHQRYLSRFSMKLKLMFSQVQKDIRFDSSSGQALSRQHSDENVDRKLASLSRNEMSNGEHDALVVDDSESSPHIANGIVGFLESMSEHEIHSSDNHSTGEIDSHISLEIDQDSRPSSVDPTEELTEQQLMWRKHNRERIERRKTKMAVMPEVDVSATTAL